MSLIEWLAGQGGKISLPTMLDTFMRANNQTGKPQDLFVPPLMLPVFIMNPSNYAPIINWYDRNPSEATRSWDSTAVGPHALTVRVGYTVPAGRKALVTCAYFELVRTAAAVAVGNATLYLTIGAFATLHCRMFDNTVGYRANASLTLNHVLTAGETIEGASADLSNGGTIDYDLTLFIKEFDA